MTILHSLTILDTSNISFLHPSQCQSGNQCCANSASILGRLHLNWVTLPVTILSFAVDSIPVKDFFQCLGLAKFEVRVFAEDGTVCTDVA